jgi:hypothetical protein
MLYFLHQFKGFKDLLHANILTTVPFADDQVVMTATENSLQKLLHMLPKTASMYKFTTFAAETKILTLTGKELVRAKIPYLPYIRRIFS